MKRLQQKPTKPSGRLDHFDRVAHEMDVVVWRLLKLIPDEHCEAVREILDECRYTQACDFLVDESDKP